MKKPSDFDQTPSGETAKGRNPHHVQVGDIWQDNDPRHQAGSEWGERFVKVYHVNEEAGDAEIYACDRSGTLTPAGDKRYRNGTPSRIRLSRFKPTSTGYRKVT